MPREIRKGLLGLYNVNFFKTLSDCNVTFTRVSYVHHKSCVSENERYGGKDYVEKGAKGDQKQKNWMGQIEEAMQNANLSKGAQRIWPRASF